MYINSLHLYGIWCFGKAEMLNCWHPERRVDPQTPMPEHLRNVNVLLGNNGAGKSSVLRAIALAALSPVIVESGYVPYRLVRRPVKGASLVKASVVVHRQDEPSPPAKPIDMLCRLQLKAGDVDRFDMNRVPDRRIRNIYDDRSAAFFIVGYGATRRSEVGEYSPSGALKTRGQRYQRVATLFEDHVALTPVDWALANLQAKRRLPELRTLLNKLLPTGASFVGIRNRQPIFRVFKRATPFAALSDGFRAYLSWVVDLLGHLVGVCPPKQKLAKLRRRDGRRN